MNQLDSVCVAFKVIINFIIYIQNPRINRNLCTADEICVNKPSYYDLLSVKKLWKPFSFGILLPPS